MRPLGPILLAVAALAAVPASATTRDEHEFTMSFNTTRPASSAGIKFLTDRVGYVPPVAGQPADRVARTVFALPPGTRTDTRAVPNCSAKKLMEGGGDACPPRSKVGSGTAIAITGISLIDPIPLKVTVYVGKAGLLAHLTGLQTAVVDLRMKGNRISTDVPRTCLPPGTLADGCSNGEAVLKTLDVKLGARKKGDRALIRTPRTCPATGVWTSRAVYTFVNGDSETVSATSPCRK